MDLEAGMDFEAVKAKATAQWEGMMGGEKPCILVGAGTCGNSAGAVGVKKAIQEALAENQVAAEVLDVGCIGMCYLEPMVDIIKPGQPRISYANMTPDQIKEVIKDYLVAGNPRPDLALGTVGDGAVEGIGRLFDLPMLKPQVRVALRNCGVIDPTNIDHYIARGGYSGLVRALSMTPEAIIEEMKTSGLRGRGGAGFSTGMKWDFCRKSVSDEKYCICNADEGDPGAFMDRAVLEGDPHSVLEGMLIGSYAMGANHGVIYIRAEYPLAIQRLEIAIQQMKDYGFLGEDILGSGFGYEVKIKEGAGAFVCGEETALMMSVEGKRGMPRPRPPFPAVSGVWEKPTNINNVETWANVSAIFEKSGEWFAGFGTEGSKGTKTFALAGKVNHTGLVEVPMGMTLREIVYDIGGGILDDKPYKAVQTGGPSGGCLPESTLDMQVDYETLAQAGSIVGSGGMIVMDENTCVVDLARYFLEFCQEESCGKCVPCRVGTRQMLGILTRITEGKGQPGDIEQLQRLAETIKSGALCALGGTAPNPTLTTLRYFLEEYRAHIEEQRCPALSCKALISFYILPDKCQGCGQCAKVCPPEAITGGKRMVHVIDQEKCVRCGSCLDTCPPRFSSIVKVSGEELDVPKEPTPVKPKEKAKKAEGDEDSQDTQEQEN
jgi:NADH:ubiquinone oxidoreductase subunit F (NADH-binding)/ferredoxin/(2Fe-2S) ferredoxin